MTSYPLKVIKQWKKKQETYYCSRYSLQFFVQYLHMRQYILFPLLKFEFTAYFRIYSHFVVVRVYFFILTFFYEDF